MAFKTPLIAWRSIFWQVRADDGGLIMPAQLARPCSGAIPLQAITPPEPPSGQLRFPPPHEVIPVRVGETNAWFFKGLGGIFPDTAAPGFKHILLRPISSPA